MSGHVCFNSEDGIGPEAAERIKAAYDEVLEEGNPEELRRDVGGTGVTKYFTDAIIKRM